MNSVRSSISRKSKSMGEKRPSPGRLPRVRQSAIRRCWPAPRGDAVGCLASSGQHDLGHLPASGNDRGQGFLRRREFAASAHLPGDWIYANLGLLVVEGRLPKTARLASMEELQEIEDGLPIACFGISHDGGKITRFTRFEPQCHRSNVYRIGGSDRLPENLRLLELKARNSENVFGSPIVNRQGDVIAVYGKAAPREKTGVKDLHYATVLDPSLLQSWIKGDKSGWVTPPKPAIDGGTQDDPQTPRSPVP